jgi:hypothetical protein
MKLPETVTEDTSLFIDECESHSTSQQESSPCSIDDKSSPSSEYIYNEIVKAIENKRASWNSCGQQEYGLPPTGKRIDGDPNTINKTSNRIRMRSKSTKNYPSNPTSFVRPVSFTERYDRLLIDKFSNQSLVRIDLDFHDR